MEHPSALYFYLLNKHLVNPTRLLYENEVLKSFQSTGRAVLDRNVHAELVLLLHQQGLDRFVVCARNYTRGVTRSLRGMSTSY